MRSLASFDRYASVTFARRYAQRSGAGLVCLLLLAGPAAAGTASLRAEQITRANAPQLLIGGPDAIGGMGDWYLGNDVVEVIVDDPARAHGKLNHGGTIVDAGLIDRKGEDQFARLFPILNLDQRVFVNYDTIRAEVKEAEGWARLVVASSQGISSLPRGGWLRRRLDVLVPKPEALHNVFIETEYRVHYGEPFVHLTTTIRNDGTEPAPIFAYGDVWMRGGLALRAFTGNTLDPSASRGFHHLAFDRGDLTRAGDAMAPFSFVSAPGVRGYPPIAYAFFSPERTRDGRVPFFGVTDDQVTMMTGFLFEHDWKRLSAFRIWRASRSKLPAGQSWTYQRRLVITGKADVSSTTDLIFPQLGYTSRVSGVTGTVVPKHVPHMLHVVEALSGAPVTVMGTDTSGPRAGVYNGVLPPGNFVLRIHAPQRPVASRQIEVPDRSYFADALDHRSPDPGYLVFEPGFSGGEPMRVVVSGHEDTPDPLFEPELLDFRLNGERVPSPTETNSLYFVGDASDPHRVAIPPGTYRLTATRGLEHDVASVEVHVAGPSAQALVPPLRPARALSLSEFVSADFHVHAQASDDTQLSNEMRLRTYLAQGVEVFAATDHDHVSNYARELAALGAKGRIHVLPGAEITSSAPGPVAPWSIGHTNAWPLRRDALAHRQGAPPSQNLRLADLYALLRRDFGVEVVQMNHPRHEGVGESGYLNALGPEGQPYDPGKPITAPPNAHLLTPGADGHTRAIDFDAIELMNGPSYAVFLRVRRDLYSFLKQGFRRTGTAVSDNHGPQRPALPRSYVQFPTGLQDFDSHAFNAAIRAGRVFCTTGPLFTRFRVNGRRMGDQVAAPDGRVVVELAVAAAPWVPVERVRVLVNGEVRRTFRDLPPLEAQKVTRLETELELTLERDSFITLEAGTTLPRDPGAPNTPVGGVYALVAPGFVPMAFANAIYVDVDQNGQFDPPGL